MDGVAKVFHMYVVGFRALEKEILLSIGRPAESSAGALSVCIEIAGPPITRWEGRRPASLATASGEQRGEKKWG